MSKRLLPWVIVFLVVFAYTGSVFFSGPYPAYVYSGMWIGLASYALVAALMMFVMYRFSHRIYCFGLSRSDVELLMDSLNINPEHYVIKACGLRIIEFKPSEVLCMESTITGLETKIRAPEFSKRSNWIGPLASLLSLCGCIGYLFWLNHIFLVVGPHLTELDNKALINPVSITHKAQEVSINVTRSVVRERDDMGRGPWIELECHISGISNQKLTIVQAKLKSADTDLGQASVGPNSWWAGPESDGQVDVELSLLCSAVPKKICHADILVNIFTSIDRHELTWNIPEDIGRVSVDHEFIFKFLNYKYQNNHSQLKLTVTPPAQFQSDRGGWIDRFISASIVTTDAKRTSGTATGLFDNKTFDFFDLPDFSTGRCIIGFTTAVESKQLELHIDNIDLSSVNHN